jgi:plastocyanin
MSRVFARSIPLLFVLGSACSDGPSGPAQPVFSSLTLSTQEPTIFTSPPGNSTALTARAMDQNGQPMSGLGNPTFTSDDAGIAAVDPSGTVTAVATGTTRIRASLTASGATHSASIEIKVTAGDPQAFVAAPAIGFLPAVVNLAQGGTVTWSFAAVPHNVVFSTAGAPANFVNPWANASHSRTFPEPGTYRYECTVHAGMSGQVVVR